jgi:type VI secretion system protein ImpG
LPDDLRNFDGYRLLQEYFAFPSRFLFFSLKGLRPLLAQSGDATTFDIIILLDKADDQLERVVDKNHLALHCTPVVNLFAKVAERQKLSDSQHEYHLVVDNIRPMDYEIYAVTRIHASVDGQRDDQEFRPFWRSQSQDNGNYGAYFSLRREQRGLSNMPSATVRVPGISARRCLPRWWMNSTRPGAMICVTSPPKCSVPVATCR